MGEEAAERDGRPSSLSAALRAARLEQAERMLAVGELRDAEIGRLELLRDMLEPVLSAVPPEVDIFDVGLVPGARPRLFVDMIAFVEMGRDRRTYRLLQDRRHGRVLLAESDSLAAMVEAVTAYVARRLVEREALLASLGEEARLDRRRSPPSEARPPPRLWPAAFRAVKVVVDGLGVATLAGLAWLGFHFAHGRLPHW